MNERFTPIISERAASDIAKICGYIEADDPAKAEEVYLRLSAEIWTLEFMPRKFRIFERRANPELTVHAMSVSPYIVYYRVSETDLQVNVLSVLHGARQQPRRFRGC